MTKSYAGAYRNNCALHCIAHTWWSMPDEKIRELFSTHPIFDEIMLEFYRYYNLEGTPNIDDFIALNRSISHPLDTEVLWGQVLRGVLRKQLSSEAQAQVNDEALIPDDIVGELTKKMGANLMIHASDASLDQDVVPLSLTEIKSDNPSWTVELYHTQRGGGHYDFTYQDEAKDKQHNQFFHAKIDEWGRRLPLGHPQLYEATNTVGTNEQKQAIQRIVVEQLRRVKAKPAVVPIKEEVVDPAELEALFSLRRSPSPRLSVDEDELPRLVISAKPQSQRRVAFTEPEAEEPGKAPALRTPIAPKAQELRWPKNFDREFQQTLTQKFKRDKWDYQVLSDDKLHLALAEDKGKYVAIEKQDDAMIFSSSKENHSFVVDAANAYAQSMADKHEEIAFEIDAKDSEQAIEFLASLQENGFDISQITAIRCKNEPVPDDKMQSYVNELVRRAHASSAPKMGA